jgi:hypothetical protein
MWLTTTLSKDCDERDETCYAGRGRKGLPQHRKSKCEACGQGPDPGRPAGAFRHGCASRGEHAERGEGGEQRKSHDVHTACHRAAWTRAVVGDDLLDSRWAISGPMTSTKAMISLTMRLRPPCAAAATAVAIAKCNQRNPYLHRVDLRAPLLGEGDEG